MNLLPGDSARRPSLGRGGAGGRHVREGAPLRLVPSPCPSPPLRPPLPSRSLPRLCVLGLLAWSEPHLPISGSLWARARVSRGRAEVGAATCTPPRGPGPAQHRRLAPLAWAGEASGRAGAQAGPGPGPWVLGPAAHCNIDGPSRRPRFLRFQLKAFCCCSLCSCSVAMET